MGPKVIVLDGTRPSLGSVLISYIIDPFKKEWDESQSRGHTNVFELKCMVQIYQELGFRVEVIDWHNHNYKPANDCRIMIDIYKNLEILRDKLPSGCRKIFHATGAHWKTQNYKEVERLNNLKSRMGKSLKPRRQVDSFGSAEIADDIVVLGNEFTKNSYDYAPGIKTRIPISSAYEFDWIENRDYQKARRRFLWVGSYGMVHKGLDLVLEAFAGMLELELTVCGRPEKEEDFFRLYERELKHTPNIHFQGWINMSSPEFLDIVRTHAAVVYPSCSEGGGGSVIHCMHAGMIPICTREASVDLLDFGILIREGSVSAVQEAVRKVASMNASEVERRARASWFHVRAVHSQEHFAKNYAEFALSLIA